MGGDGHELLKHLSRHCWSTYEGKDKPEGIHYWHQLNGRELGLILDTYGKFGFTHEELFRNVVRDVI